MRHKGEKLSFRHPSVILATWFGCGLLRPAPGTWGTLGALPFGVFITLYYGPYNLAAAAVVVFIMGLWAADRYEKLSGTHDSSSIVIDEVAGMWIAMIPATSLFMTAVAFALFRALDILKPWPVGWADKKLPGGFGVMADDVLAGGMAAVIVYGLRRYAGLG